MEQTLGYSKFIEMKSSWIWLNLEKILNHLESFDIMTSQLEVFSDVSRFFTSKKSILYRGHDKSKIRADPSTPEIAWNSIQNDWRTLTDKYLILN